MRRHPCCVLRERDRPPFLIAHRGGAALYPENTLYAFQEAVHCHQAAGIELDLHLTADGEVVVLHDDTVERTTDGHGRVAWMRLAQLRELDAGWGWTASDGCSRPFAGKGIRIPTLGEVLDQLSAPLILELKEGSAQLAYRVAALVRQYRAEHRVMIASFLPQAIRWMRRIAPHLLTGVSWPTAVWLAHLEHLRWPGVFPRFLGQNRFLLIPVYYEGTVVYSPRLLKNMHRRGVPVHLWTVNATDTMSELSDDGVDAILTDHPDLFNSWVSSHLGAGSGRR
ncbi:MAG: glycerophosphodiester phosphodiesterase [Candidatus Schekmanbacteria bacterium]|nr:glycerophosphodiester phosphodiesterase [Candidatus Schekmanbacteria bacterium]